MQEICSSQGEEVSMDKMMNKFDDAIMKDKVNDPVLSESIVTPLCFRFISTFHSHLCSRFHSVPVCLSVCFFNLSYKMSMSV